jgi:hypothetical protein
MRYTGRRRSAPDPFFPSDQPAWLVVRDQRNFIVESVELAARCDLRAALTAARDVRVAQGWVADSIGGPCAFFFASRASTRVLIAIERRLPTKSRIRALRTLAFFKQYVEAHEKGNR